MCRVVNGRGAPLAVLAALLLFSMPASAASAQPGPVDDGEPGKGEVVANESTSIVANQVRSITTSDGLPAAEVRDIAQDADGFVWFATIGGVGRWDGRVMDVFSPRGATEALLPSGSVTSLAADPVRGMWASAGRLVHIDPWSQVVTDTGLDSELVRRHEDDLWSFSVPLLTRLSATTGEVVEEIDLTGIDRTDELPALMEVDRDGNVYIGTEEALFLVDAARTVHRYTIAGGTVGFAQRIDGGVWLSSDSGLWTMAPSDRRPHRVIAFDDVPCRHTCPASGLEERADGSVWVGLSTGGLLRFDPATGALVQEAAGPGAGDLGSGSLNVAFEDRSGGLWMAVFGTGVQYLRAAPTGLYSILPGETQGVRPRLAVLDLHLVDDTLWVATDGDGLHRVDLATGIWDVDDAFRDVDDPLAGPGSDGVIGLAAVGDTGDLWVGSWSGGLSIFTPSTGEFRPVPELVDASVFDVVEGVDGEVWAAVWGEGIRVIDQAGRTVTRLGPGGDIAIANDRPVAIVPGKRIVWIGGWHGIERVDLETGIVGHWSIRDGSLYGDIVFDLVENGDGSLWLATSAGLELFDPEQGSSVLYDHNVGLPMSSAVQIVPHGDRPALWVAAESGLALFDTDRRVVSRLYGDGAGPITSSYARYGSVVTDAGDIVYATNDGLIVVPSSVPLAGAGDPAVFVTGVTVDGVSRSVEQALELSPNDHQVTFTFTGLDYDAPEQLRFRYRLAGVDDAWTTADVDRRSVTYVDLGAGSYSFEVEVLASDDLSTDPEGVADQRRVAILGLDIAPHWYQQRLVRLGAIAALVLAALGFLRHRVRKEGRETERLRLLVEERTSELAEAVDRSEVANRSKTRFLSMVSHELRTPLNSVLGFAQLLEDTPQSDQQALWTERILFAGSHLQGMIEELIQLASAESADRVAHVDEVSLHELVAEVADLVRHSAAGDAMPEIRVSADGEMAATYLLDARRIRQVLINLVDNAVEHGGEGAEIEVVLTRLESLDTEDPLGHGIRFEVLDPGPGMEAGEFRELLAPFARGAGTNSNGLGLGLAIAQSLVQMFGGELRLSRTLDARTCISFDLVVAPVCEQESPDTPAAPDCHVLVVDDELHARQLLGDRMVMLGIDVALAESGPVALERIEARRPDLVFCDHMMPEMTGAQFVVELEQRLGNDRPPVVGVTAIPDIAQATGMYDRVLPKPVALARLVELIDELVADTNQGVRS